MIFITMSQYVTSCPILPQGSKSPCYLDFYRRICFYDIAFFRDKFIL